VLGDHAGEASGRAEVKAVAHDHHREPDLFRPRRHELDRLTRGQLTERIVRIDDDRAAAVAHHLAGAAGRHRTFDDAFDIHGQQHHPVGRDALEVGGNQIIRHHPRVLGGDPNGPEDIGDGRREPLRINRNGLGAGWLRRHQRASSSLAYQDGRWG
jgi:hypothetical protein